MCPMSWLPLNLLVLWHSELRQEVLRHPHVTGRLVGTCQPVAAIQSGLRVPKGCPSLNRIQGESCLEQRPSVCNVFQLITIQVCLFCSPLAFWKLQEGVSEKPPLCISELAGWTVHKLESWKPWEAAAYKVSCSSDLVAVPPCKEDPWLEQILLRLPPRVLSPFMLCGRLQEVDTLS